MKSKSLKIYLLDRDSLPDYFPTHRHNSLFWEALGRTVATFGFLEDVLARAIFAITATTRYGESDIDQAYVAWLATLNRALTDSLSSLIDAYQKAIKGNGKCETENIDLVALQSNPEKSALMKCVEFTLPEPPVDAAC